MNTTVAGIDSRGSKGHRPSAGESEHPRAWGTERGRHSLAARILTLQLVLGLVVIVPIAVLVLSLVREAEHERAVDAARSVTATLVTSPWVLEAVTAPDPAAVLAGPVEEARRQAGVDFVVVMSPEGTRYTHPDPSQVGGTFIGDISGAQQGRTTQEDAVGTLGPSVRVVSPVLGSDDEIVALVSTGVVLRTVSGRVRETLLPIGLIAGAVLVLALIGTVLVARSVRRATFGLGPQGLARLHSYQDAVLHSLQAGLVLLDPRGTIVLINDEARRLLDAPDLTAGTSARRAPLGPELVELLASGRVTDGEAHTAGGRALVVTQVEAVRDGRALGTVATLRDRTDLARLSGELDNLRQFTTSLRARAHESDNRLHTVAMLVELGHLQEALEFAGAVSAQSQELVDVVSERVADSTVAALLLGKAAQADERGIALTIDPEYHLPPGAVPPHELVTVLGNLLDNAMDAVSGRPVAWIHLSGDVDRERLRLVVTDSGAPIPPSHRTRIFASGFSTKSPSDPGGRGVGLTLALAAAQRLGGTLELLDGDVTSFRLTVPVAAR